MQFRALAFAAIALASSFPAVAQSMTPAAPPAAAEWVARSNDNAKVLLEVLARFSPEGAGQFGVEGLDREITQIPPDVNERNVAALEKAIATLESRLAKETDPAVRQDLQILIASARENVDGIRINQKYYLPYFNMSGAVFQGLRSLLDEQIPQERRTDAVVRLKKYAGLEKGYTPITHQARDFTRAKLAAPGLLGPFKDDIEKDLANSERYVAGVEELFKTYQIAGYEAPFQELKKQLLEYNDFLRKEVLPRANSDFRLPADVYAYQLASSGIDMPVAELISRAKTSFREIQNEMQALAPLVAREKNWTASDYRDVVRELKKKQLVGDAILPHYQGRIKQLEKLIRDNGVVTVPAREMQIRLASEAESAAVPAPNMRPPRMIGNTGERGTFVLPLRIPTADGKESVGFDDFTFEASSWTLGVHEGRPGHELQFASIVEKGVSQARVLFAFNSVNVEGWALYMESEMKPLLPLDGQLVSLQHRLLRAARAFLDPSLQLGMMTRDEALKVLEKDVVLSSAMAQQEVERYTFRSPGQAPSYYCGYSRLTELRTDVERMMGEKFNRQSYHDFILGQGLLTPTLLRDAVMTGYVK